MHSVGFKPKIQAIEGPQTYALNHAATGIGLFHCLPIYIMAQLYKMVLKELLQQHQYILVSS